MSANDDRIAALEDAGPRDGWGDKRQCNASGPGGECARSIGHDVDKPLLHWSWDTDHYVAWPVGWRSKTDCIDAVMALEAPEEADATDDFIEGYEAALQQVKILLGKSRY